MGKKVSDRKISFPFDAQNISSALFVLPADPVRAALHLENTGRLREFFSIKKTGYFCEVAAAKVMQSVSGKGDIIWQYPKEGMKPFCDQAAEWIRKIRESGYEACFFLDPQADLTAYHIISSAGIPLIVCDADSPFREACTVAVCAAPGTGNVPDRIHSFYKCLSGQPSGERWTLRSDEKQKEEVRFLLNQQGIQDTDTLCCFQAEIERAHLKEWVKAVHAQRKRTIVISPDPVSGELRRELESTGTVLLDKLSYPYTAILAERCEYVVAEKNPLLYIAYYSGASVIGFFDKQDMGAWEIKSSGFISVASEEPETVQKILNAS